MKRKINYKLIKKRIKFEQKVILFSRSKAKINKFFTFAECIVSITCSV